MLAALPILERDGAFTAAFRKEISIRHDPFGARCDFPLASGKRGRHCALAALEAAGRGKVSRMPVSIRIVLESLLRNRDDGRITEARVRQLAGWQPTAMRSREIPFVVARIVLRDFTGVPLLGNLAAMPGAARRFGRNPEIGSMAIVDDEEFDILGLEGDLRPPHDVTRAIRQHDGARREVAPLLRVDTPVEVGYLRHGDILPYVLRRLLPGAEPE